MPERRERVKQDEEVIEENSESGRQTAREEVEAALELHV